MIVGIRGVRCLHNPASFARPHLVPLPMPAMASWEKKGRGKGSEPRATKIYHVTFSTRICASCLSCYRNKKLEHQKEARYWIQLAYSGTCPCSAAAARSAFFRASMAAKPPGSPMPGITATGAA